MTEKQNQGNQKSQGKKYDAIRDQFFPDTKKLLWVPNSKDTSHYFQPPRTLPHIFNLIDSLSSGKPLSKTYLTLWARLFPQGIIINKNPRELAVESGFSADRGETAWKGRMKKLCELGFIQAQAGADNEYQYILVTNPEKVIADLVAEGTIVKTNTHYMSYFERLIETSKM